MNFINCIIRLASCTVIQYALVAVSQFMNIDEFRFTLINHNFLCFVLDVASLWNFSSICLSTELPPLSDPPQHIRYSMGGARDVVELSTPTSKFEHLLISFSFCLFFYVVLAVFFPPFWRLIWTALWFCPLLHHNMLARWICCIAKQRDSLFFFLSCYHGTISISCTLFSRGHLKITSTFLFVTSTLLC